MDLVIWHNPRCSKSRETLKILQEHGTPPRIRLYLDEPPDAGEIEEVLAMLGMEPRELMRTREAEYRDLGLADPARTHAELVAAMAANPRLIERPVVIKGRRAALGRPPENVMDLL